MTQLWAWKSWLGGLGGWPGQPTSPGQHQPAKDGAEPAGVVSPAGGGRLGVWDSQGLVVTAAAGLREAEGAVQRGHLEGF